MGRARARITRSLALSSAGTSEPDDHHQMHLFLLVGFGGPCLHISISLAYMVVKLAVVISVSRQHRRRDDDGMQTCKCASALWRTWRGGWWANYSKLVVLAPPAGANGQ